VDIDFLPSPVDDFLVDIDFSISCFLFLLLLQGDRPIAVFDVEAKYTPNKPLEALKASVVFPLSKIKQWKL
jgi:hypothetical protein